MGASRLLQMTTAAGHFLHCTPCQNRRPHAQAVAVAIRLLQMTAAAGHFLQENRLYKAFRLLQRVRDALPATDEDEDPNGR